MGKKSKSGGGEEKKRKATEMVLKVAMHCKCNGCRDKIRNGINELALIPGVVAVDKTAVESKGEVRLMATAKPEKLQERLHKTTGKKVDLQIVPQPKPADANDKNGDAAAAQAAALAEALRQVQQQAAVHVVPAGTWASNGGYGTAAVAYPPWGVQPEGGGYYYSPSYPAAAAGGWGPYAAAAAAYPPPGQQLGHGAYRGGAVSPWYTRG